MALSTALQSIVRLFIKYDKDGDGKLTMDEIKEMMKNDCDCPETKKKMEGCAKGDCDGGKSFDDYLGCLNEMMKCCYKNQQGGAATKPLSTALQTIVSMFVKYDKDSDGKLTKDEMKEMMENEVDCPEAKGKTAAAGCNKGGCDGDKSFDDYLGCLNEMMRCGYKKMKGGCGTGCK